MIKIKVQASVYCGKKSCKQRLRAKQGNDKETLQYKVCVPENTATQNRTKI